MNQKTLAILGLLAAPLVPVIVGFALSPNPASLGAVGFFLLAMGFYCIALGYITVVGVPVFFLLDRRGTLDTRSIALSGLAIGTVAALLFHYPKDSLIIDILVMGPMGLACAMLFWRIRGMAKVVEG